MIEITAEVVGAEVVQARLAGLPDQARSRVAAKVQKLGVELERKIKEEKLSGQVLNVRTGRLRRQVNEQTTASGDRVQSAVGTNVGYGAAWELGFDRLVGKGVRGGTSKAKALLRAHKKHYGARPFLQPALDEMRPRVIAELSGGLVA